MTTDTTSGETLRNRQSDHDLDRRYGRIGISALVAALPYGSESANSRSAERHEDRAA